MYYIKIHFSYTYFSFLFPFDFFSSTRHQNREAEPKDYDVSEVPLGKKNLCHSSYRRFGNSDSEVSRNWTS